jgi:hypothetical protein
LPDWLRTGLAGSVWHAGSTRLGRWRHSRSALRVAGRRLGGFRRPSRRRRRTALLRKCASGRQDQYKPQNQTQEIPPPWCRFAGT